jgi:hypothetical protein
MLSKQFEHISELSCRVRFYHFVKIRKFPHINTKKKTGETSKKKMPNEKRKIENRKVGKLFAGSIDHMSVVFV